MSGGTIFDPDRIVFVFDHTFSPPSQADAGDHLPKRAASQPSTESATYSTPAQAVCIT